MGTMEAIIRPLAPAERRLLRCCAAHRRNRLRALGKRVFLTGLVVFGTLWLLTLFATQFGANARARPIRWYIPTLLWLVFGSAISLQSYRAGKRKFASSVRAFESALQANSAREVRIRAHEMVEFGDRRRRRMLRISARGPTSRLHHRPMVLQLADISHQRFLDRDGSRPRRYSCRAVLEETGDQAQTHSQDSSAHQRRVENPGTLAGDSW